MTAATCAGAWVLAALIAGLCAAAGRGRVAAVLPALAGPLALLAVSGDAGGPLGGAGTTLALSRPAAGLLALAGPVTAIVLALDRRAGGAEAGAACLAGGLAVVILAATSPLVWATAVAGGLAVVAVRWLVRAPGRVTLAAGRVAGLGAAALLAAACLLPPTLVEGDTRPRLAGLLLAGGLAACLAVPPLGGWAAGAAPGVPPADRSLHALLVAPALLVSAGAVLPALPAATHDTAAAWLLGAGLTGAVAGAIAASRAAAGAVHTRLWLADLSLAVAALAAGGTLGRAAGLLLVVTHLLVAPVLMPASSAVAARPQRVAWLALTTIPPAPAAWGRLLALEALAASGRVPLVAGVAVAALQTGAAVRAMVSTRDAGGPEGRVRMRGAVAWVLCVAALGVGLVPDGLAGRLLGSTLG